MAIVIAALRAKFIALFGAEGAAQRTGRGRRESRSFFSFANNFRAVISAQQEEFLHLSTKNIAIALDALCDARRDTTSDELERIARTRDGQAMGMLNGEPVQIEVNTRMHVARKNVNESLGEAFARRWPLISHVAQAEANEVNKTLYAVVVRYAVVRDVMTAAKAKAADMESLTYLPSKNTCVVLITDNPKQFEGYLAIAGEFQPDTTKEVVFLPKKLRAAAKAAQRKRVARSLSHA